MPRSKADQNMDAWAAWAQGKGPKPGGAAPKKTKSTSSIVGAEEIPGYGMRTVGATAGPNGGAVDTSGLPDPGKAGGAGAATEGRRKPYTAKELADARKQQEQLLKAHLSGPWTQESILGQYNGTVASILGNQHPKAEQFARYGMENKMDADTFSGWLRARPEYLQTENYRKAKGDYLSVLAEVFGYR